MRVVFLVVAVIAEDAREGRHPGEGGEGSGNDMDGNEDLGDNGRFSHCGESGESRIAAAAGGGTGQRMALGFSRVCLSWWCRTGSADDRYGQWVEIEGSKR